MVSRRGRPEVRMGLGDEALHRDGGARRGGGGRARPGRARGPARLDGAAPARSRLRPAVRRAAADLQARQAADLLQHRHRGARQPFSRRRRRCPSPTTSRRRCSSRSGLSGTALEGLTVRRARRARSQTCSHSDASSWPRPLSRRRHSQEATTVAFPGLDGDPARLRALRAARLGARLRDPRCEGAALDRHEQLAPDVRPLRRRGQLHLGRPGGRRCLRRACRPAVRPVGEGGVAAALRRRSRGATMTGSRVEPPDHRRLLHVRGAVPSLPRRLQLGR